MIRFANLDWKPCPFCGKEELDIKDENHFIENDGCMHVGCTNCDTDVWLFNTEKCTYDEAVEVETMEEALALEAENDFVAEDRFPCNKLAIVKWAYIREESEE